MTRKAHSPRRSEERPEQPCVACRSGRREAHEGERRHAGPAPDSSNSLRAPPWLEFEPTNTPDAPSQAVSRTHIVLVDPRTKLAS